MRVAAGARASSAGTSTVPAGSLYAPSGRGIYLLECGVFNTTTTATSVALRRFTTTGTQGTGLDEVYVDMAGTPAGTAFNTHSAGPTITAGFLRRAVLGAANGAGVIWTGRFWIPAGTANGVGFTVPDGTGQVWDFYFEWEE